MSVVDPPSRLEQVLRQSGRPFHGRRFRRKGERQDGIEASGHGGDRPLQSRKPQRAGIPDLVRRLQPAAGPLQGHAGPAGCWRGTQAVPPPGPHGCGDGARGHEADRSAQEREGRSLGTESRPASRPAVAGRPLRPVDGRADRAADGPGSAGGRASARCGAAGTCKWVSG